MDYVANGNISAAKETTAQAIKAKTDPIPADITTQLDITLPSLLPLLKRLMLFWDAKTNIPGYSVIQGTWQILLSSNILLGSYLSNITTKALNDEIRFAFWSPDTAARTLYFRGTTDPTAGIVTVLVDTIIQGTVDFYAAAGVNNAIFSIPITPVRAGNNVLILRLSTKNVASTAYLLNIIEMWFA